MVMCRPRSFIRLIAALVAMLSVIWLASCSSGEVETTTSVMAVNSGTAIPDSATTSTVASVTREATTASTGPPATPPPIPPSTQNGESAVTPPSVPAGSSTYLEQLPELQKAAQERPQDLEALRRLAVGYYQAKQYAGAEETYLKMLAIENTAETHNNLGNVYRDWGRADQATVQYDAAMALDPSLLYPYSNLAALYIMAGDLARAREVVQSGIQNTNGAAQQQLQILLQSLK
jgi:hypothetical protein